jgi:hypothetical protein
MHDDDILLLTDSEKAIILDNFITRIGGINRKSGQVIGSYQILDMLEQIAIDVGYIECPTCHQKKKKEMK